MKKKKYRELKNYQIKDNGRLGLVIKTILTTKVPLNIKINDEVIGVEKNE